MFIVIGIAGNKSDLIDNEQVKEEEVTDYAKEIGVIFKLTSACTSVGIEELFKSIGCKLIDPNYKDDDNIENKDNNAVIQLDKNQVKNDEKKKNNCC